MCESGVTEDHFGWEFDGGPRPRELPADAHAGNAAVGAGG